MKYGYYPGCSLHSTGAEFDASFRAVCSVLGVELEELKDWLCCGTSPAHSSSHDLALALPLKNLAIAESMNIGEMVVPCAACFSRFKYTMHEIDSKPEALTHLNKLAETDYRKKVKVSHPLGIFSSDQMLTTISEKTAKDLSAIKVACYYGCLLTRPPKVTDFDECEYPMSMDNVLRAAGITTVDWSSKTDCCGAVFALSKTDIVHKLCNDILAEAKARGADAIAVACPLCHANLDTRQEEIEAKYSTSYKIPIFYFTQLLGLALGVGQERLETYKHLVATDPVLNMVR